MMVAEVETGARFRAGQPRTLFESQEFRSRYDRYAVSPDGERFLMVRRSPEAIPDRIDIVLNWFEELKRLVPTD